MNVKYYLYTMISNSQSSAIINKTCLMLFLCGWFTYNPSTVVFTCSTQYPSRWNGIYNPSLLLKKIHNFLCSSPSTILDLTSCLKSFFTSYRSHSKSNLVLSRLTCPIWFLVFIKSSQESRIDYGTPTTKYMNITQTHNHLTVRNKSCGLFTTNNEVKIKLGQQ